MKGYSQGDISPMNDWQGIAAVLQRILKLPWRPTCKGEGLWVNGEINKPSLIRGIEPVGGNTGRQCAEHMKVGSLDTLKPGEWGDSGGRSGARLGVRGRKRSRCDHAAGYGHARPAVCRGSELFTVTRLFRDRLDRVRTRMA